MRQFEDGEGHLICHRAAALHEEVGAEDQALMTDDVDKASDMLAGNRAHRTEVAPQVLMPGCDCGDLTGTIPRRERIKRDDLNVRHGFEDGFQSPRRLEARALDHMEERRDTESTACPYQARHISMVKEEALEAMVPDGSAQTKAVYGARELGEPGIDSGRKVDTGDTRGEMAGVASNRRRYLIVRKSHRQHGGRAVRRHEDGLIDAETVHDREPVREHACLAARVESKIAFVGPEVVVDVEDAQLLAGSEIHDHRVSSARGAKWRTCDMISRRPSSSSGSVRMGVIVVATAYPAPGRTDAVRAALLRAVPFVHAEEGCRLYALREGSDRLVLIEKWESQEALDRHAAAPALARLRSELADLTASDLDIQILTPVPGGTVLQGAL
jgi:quinol monooxygenase YgiN